MSKYEFKEFLRLQAGLTRYMTLFGMSVRPVEVNLPSGRVPEVYEEMVEPGEAVLNVDFRLTGFRDRINNPQA